MYVRVADGSRRVFVLGPSHHAYLEGCALSDFDELATPLGNLPVDMQTNKALDATRLFRVMKGQVDEDEHSIEMHLPYLRKVFQGRDVSVVPILVGQLSPVSIAQYASVLAEHVADPATLVVVSSDFCHWGERFRYTRYYDGEAGQILRLSGSTQRSEYAARPIYEAIQALDADGMAAISFDPAPTLPVTHTSAAEARKAFAVYLSQTGNTICGSRPIALLLATLHHLETEGQAFRCRFVHYEQSSAVHTPGDSSVSYAAGYVQQI